MEEQNKNIVESTNKTKKGIDVNLIKLGAGVAIGCLTGVLVTSTIILNRYEEDTKQQDTTMYRPITKEHVTSSGTTTATTYIYVEPTGTTHNPLPTQATVTQSQKVTQATVTQSQKVTQATQGTTAKIKVKGNVTDVSSKYSKTRTIEIDPNKTYDTFYVFKYNDGDETLEFVKKDSGMTLKVTTPIATSPTTRPIALTLREENGKVIAKPTSILSGRCSVLGYGKNGVEHEVSVCAAHETELTFEYLGNNTFKISGDVITSIENAKTFKSTGNNTYEFVVEKACTITVTTSKGQRKVYEIQ